MPKRTAIQKVLFIAGGLLLGTAVTFMLVAAVNVRNKNTCKGVRIDYLHPDGGRYVDARQISRMLSPIGAAAYEGKLLDELDLYLLELRLEKDPWIRNAELYLDRDHMLHVEIEEQSPVARIFTRTNISFYIDSHLHRIPLNVGYTPRLPVFTGIPISANGGTAADTLQLERVREMVRYMQSDSVIMSLIEQADYEAPHGFVLIPKFGEQRIVFGEASQIADKFRRLKIFYTQVMSQTGWSSYEEIDLRFKDQIVAIPSGSMRQTPMTDSAVVPGAGFILPDIQASKETVVPASLPKTMSASAKPKLLMPPP